MLERQKRLNEVYEHLHDSLGVHTKGNFADAIGYARTYVSSALNGNERFLTDKLFRSICDVYPGVFNLDYLLTGEGKLLAEEEDAPPSATQAQQNDMLEMYARMIRGVDDLRVQLKEELEQVQKTAQELRLAREEFQSATAMLKRIIEDNCYTSSAAADPLKTPTKTD